MERPKRPERVEIRCTEEELAAWRAAAGLVPLSAWVRHLANEAATGA